MPSPSQRGKDWLSIGTQQKKQNKKRKVEGEREKEKRQEPLWEGADFPQNNRDAWAQNYLRG